jgi:hypothetical protein
VHEVAKDFDIKSNIVVDLLAKYFDGQKKHMTALEEDELDMDVADVSGDGFVDVEDAMLILQFDAFLIEQFPAEN